MSDEDDWTVIIHYLSGIRMVGGCATLYQIGETIMMLTGAGIANELGPVERIEVV